MTRILVTGFESYGGRHSNPSARLVAALDGGSIGNASVIAKTLPVSIARMPGLLRAMIDDLRPDAILMFGLWPGEPVIRLERLAINIAEFGIPDNDGAVLGEPVSPAGAPALMANWPAGRIEARLLAEGIPARLSDHAGTFLCNAAFYTALAHAGGSARPVIGFMHLPYLPEQVSDLLLDIRAEKRIEAFQRQDLASMGFDTQLEAARLVLSEMADALGT